MSTTDAEISETPKWLNVLENRRKRPHRLAHEIGAGSPCLICKDNCKGLNLHFWRKICIECKCRKEDHDFEDDEEYAQFEILFGTKRAKKTTLKFNTDNKTFDWIPQNASQELVVDYMNAIPQSKLPISNTEGAIYRKQQLEKQLPLHDVNPSACHNLTDKEVVEFGKYLDNLRNNVIGQGKILMFEQRKEPSNSLPSSGGEYRGIRGVLVRDHEPNVETVSSEKVNAESYPVKSSVKIDVINQNEVISGSLPHRPQYAYAYGHIAKQKSNLPGKMRDLTLADSIVDNADADRTPNAFYGARRPPPVADSENNNPSAPLTDDNCNEPATEAEMAAAARDLLRPLRSDNLADQHRPASPCSPAHSILQRTSPNANVTSATSQSLPFTPLQESRSISPRRGAGDKVRRPDRAPQPPMQSVEGLPVEPKQCAQCKEVLTPGDVVVVTDRGGESKLWHARCFICDTCKELLVDLVYFFAKGKVYCGRDYAKVMNIPRCFACDELIFVKEYTHAEGESYHVRHFCCFHCDEPLGGKKYIPKDNQPVCLDCYQERYGKNCSTCGKTISVAEQRVCWNDLNFHLRPECFCCKNCSKSLIGSKFIVKNERTFCSKDCAQLQFRK